MRGTGPARGRSRRKATFPFWDVVASFFLLFFIPPFVPAAPFFVWEHERKHEECGTNISGILTVVFHVGVLHFLVLNIPVRSPSSWVLWSRPLILYSYFSGFLAVSFLSPSTHLFNSSVLSFFLAPIRRGRWLIGVRRRRSSCTRLRVSGMIFGDDM